jgi:transposase
MGNTATTVTISSSEYEALKEKESEFEKLEALVKYYEVQLRLATHRQFGVSSEQGEVTGQLGLFDEAENTADPKLPEPELEDIHYTRRKRAGKLEEDISSLPVETVEYTLPESERICPDCGGVLRVMGHAVRKELTVIPAQIKVIEHKQEVYSCRYCENHSDHVPVIKAPMPEPVIKGSLASPSLVAHIINQKYVMHLPLYRQEKAFLREGLSLSRQTMANWIINVASFWLEPLYKIMRTELLLHRVIHADETTCQVLHEPGKKATTNSCMWLYSTSGEAEHPIILYEYQATRSSVHPKAFLNGWSGFLHADGYQGYHNLPPGITVVGCWVHLRRKFTDAYKALSAEEKPKSVIPEALRRIGTLFCLEKQWRDLGPAERQELRLSQSKPLAEAFFAWLYGLGALPQTPLGKAVKYAQDQRRWLMNFYLDGRLELSNNRIENSVRPFAVGRRNWLFCNTQNGANASAVVYSIIETAAANGLKPYEYMKFLFETLPNSTTSQLPSLLPWGKALPDGVSAPVKKEEAADGKEK